MQGNNLVTVIGGSGFIGRHVVRSLARRGYRVRVACRRPDLAGHVQPLGTPGQIVPVQVNVRYPESIAAACEGAVAVVNATSTGALYESGTQTFEAINAFGAEACARAAKAARVPVFIHISAIGADANGASAYARSKADGEARAATAFPGAIIIRPSVVFGPEDKFFNQFAEMARFSPAIPLIGDGASKFQPVFVGDIAEGIARLIERGVADGKTYEFGGPEVATFRTIIDYILATVQRKRVLVNLPWGLAKGMGSVLGLLPKPQLTKDQVELLQTDNVVGADAIAAGRTLEGLGVTPRSYESIVPSYIYRYRKSGQFTVSSST
jgi:uncharacterized protein YbjT (DUF2867 family)